MRQLRRKGWGRRARLETLESRLVLSANPLFPPAAEPDFVLGTFETTQPTGAFEQIETTLADVHESFGVSYARSAYGFDGTGQTVVVIDSGIAYDHYALGGGLGSEYRVVGGFDFTEEQDADPYDDGPAGFHGTHVAGIIGSSDETYTGVAPGVDLVGLRVFNDQGVGYFNWVEDALDWVHANKDTFANPITTVNLSLGVANFNADAVPNWAMLEDEFAQLHQDGIFVAVSAGNDFQSFGTDGVSYPAVSPYVVPVASVDNAGNFSYFSQRDDRVIAAPGQSITSTAPDYLFDFNGVTDDFATASGTSMASPYLAGASTLVREAMEFVGRTDITQDTIYNHFRDTGDVFWDSATQQNYHRLNLQAALDAIIPEDDFGSSLAAAHDWGMLDGEASLSGLIGKLDDADFFEFTAAHTGTFTFSAQGTHDFVADWTVVDGQGTNLEMAASEDGWTFDVVAGQTYTLGLESSGGLGYYDVSANLEAREVIVDWGQFDFTTFENEEVAAGQTTYKITTVRDGLLTIDARFAHAQGNVDLVLKDALGRIVSSSSAASNYERVDVVAQAGEEYFLSVVSAGGNAEVDFRVVNLVDISGHVATIHGTAAADTYDVSLGNQLNATVNGVDYRFDTHVRKIVLSDGSTGDSVTLHGSDANETAINSEDYAEIKGRRQKIEATGFSNVSIFGGGGRDTVHMYDTSASDEIVVRPFEATLISEESALNVNDFRSIRVHNQSGGGDSLQVFDSLGNDRFECDHDYSEIRGKNYDNKFFGFSRIEVFASSGRDAALLYGTAGNDHFEAWADRAVLKATGIEVGVNGFDYVHATSAGTGNDHAVFYDSAGSDRFKSWQDWSTMYGTGYHNRATGFDRADAVSQRGGQDYAYLYDTNGDDRFEAAGDTAVIQGSGIRNSAKGFDRVYTVSRYGGNDHAYLRGSEGNDSLLAAPRVAKFSSGDHRVFVTGFADVEVDLTQGGYDRTRFYDSAGDDQFFAWSDRSVMLGRDSRTLVLGSEHTDALAYYGGNDSAYLFDSAGDDRYHAWNSGATLQGDGFRNDVYGFETIRAHAVYGGFDSARLTASDSEDRLSGADGQAVVVYGGSISTIVGFEQVTAIAGRNVEAQLELDAVDYAFTRKGTWR